MVYGLPRQKNICWKRGHNFDAKEEEIENETGGVIMIYTITLNPALDKTVVIPSFGVDQVNRITQVRLDPGGKGVNVSKMIASLGGVSVAIAALGGMAGEQWKQLAEGCGFSVHVIPAEGDTRTNVKVMDPVRHTNTDINEPGAPISPEAMLNMITWLQDNVQPEDILILSGSVPASVKKDIYGQLTALGRERSAKVIVDAEGPLLDAALSAKPYLVKPNHHELAGYVGHALDSREALMEAAGKMLQAGAEHVLVSMGPDGALLCWIDAVHGMCQLFASAPSVSVASTVGAGDSMVGAVAYGLEQEMSREEILKLAVAAGTAAVTCDGSQAPDEERIKALLQEVHVH